MHNPALADAEWRPFCIYANCQLPKVAISATKADLIKDPMRVQTHNKSLSPWPFSGSGPNMSTISAAAQCSNFGPNSMTFILSHLLEKYVYAHKDGPYFSTLKMTMTNKILWQNKSKPKFREIGWHLGYAQLMSFHCYLTLWRYGLYASSLVTTLQCTIPCVHCWRLKYW